ncbi:MAG: ATP-binding protein, partial [Anderseniella sp.]
MVREYFQQLVNFTIARKITVVVMVAVTVAVTSATGFYVYRQTTQNLDARFNSLTATAKVFAASVGPHLKNRDRESALMSLRAIGQLDDIPYVSASLADGQVFAALGSAVIVEQGNGLGTKSSLDSNSGIFAMIWNPTLSVSVPVVQGGSRIGSVSLLADISDLRSQFFEGILAAIVAAFFACLLGLGISARLKRSVTSPLANLMGTITHVRDKHDYTARAQRLSDDETGKLVDAFNDMLDQINARDASLAQHRNNLERTVDERTAQLRVAKDAAVAASEAKSAFLATMSHEIRTPMNGVMVMAELLAAGNLPDGQQRYADVIVNSGNTLLTIINDLLDLSKIEAGKLELEKSPTAPRKIIDNVLALFWERAHQNKLQLASFVDKSVPDTFKCDPVRLTQILTNLANNAIKFTSEGHVGIALRVVKDQVSGSEMLEFTVLDSGIGIAEEKLASIFDAFTQADASTTRKYGGTGLGLSICKKLVDAMGGKINVTSKPGEGSRFVFTLPCENAVHEVRPDLSQCSFSPALVCMENSFIASAIANQLRIFGLDIKAVPPSNLNPAQLSQSRVLFTTAEIAHDLIDRSPANMPALILAQPIGSNKAQSMLASGIAKGTLPLPLAQADLDAIAYAMQTGDLPGSQNTASFKLTKPSVRTFPGTKVLVVDDNAVNREVIAEVLTQLDITFELAEDGAQAMVKWRQSSYDMIFMDCSMPVMDGLEATRRIRNEEDGTKRKRTPVIA